MIRCGTGYTVRDVTDPRLHPRAPSAVGWLGLVAFEATAFFTRDRPEHAALLIQIGKPDPPISLLPFRTSDFLGYLQLRGFANAMSQGARIQRLLYRMADSEILTDYGRQPGHDIFGNRYFTNEWATRSQSEGYLWLSEVLGPELIIPSYGSVTVPITGRDSNGDARVGSGLVLDEWHVLTNAHVVNGMTLDAEINNSNVAPVFSEPGGATGARISDWDVHDTVDVAVITVEPLSGQQGLLSLDGVAFRPPEWPDETYVFGYPPIAQASEAHLTVQRGQVVNKDLLVHRGQVVNPSVVSWSTTTVPDDHPNWPEGDDSGAGDEYFLYSAITRPGNSGGPIVAQDGRIIGIVAHDVLDQGRSDTPFNRGIPSHVVVEALTELGHGELVTLEDWT
jgi:S1-C subfamily serine protease